MRLQMLAGGVVLAMSAWSPAAACIGLADVGAFSAAMVVGTPTTCNPDGSTSGTLGSDDLGLLSTGSRTWAIDAPDSVLSGRQLPTLGSMRLCGDLHPSVDGLGASCLTASGSQGQGVVEFPASTVAVSDFGWSASAGGAIVATGTADVGPGSQHSLVVLMHALDEQVLHDCVNATARWFALVGVYTVV